MSKTMQKAFTPFLWLLVTIFFIRALLPTGFMPDMSGQHLLAICSGNSLTTIAVDDNNQPIEEDQQHTQTDPCPFAPFSAALLDNHHAGDDLVPAPLMISKAMTVIVAQNILPTSLDGHHQSRAPPQIS